MNLSRVVLLGSLLLSMTVRAQHGFPDSVKFPTQLQLDPDQALTKEAVAEVEFAVDPKRTLAMKRGAHFVRWLKYVPASGEPVNGYDNGTEARIFKAVSGALTSAGWKLVFVDDNKSAFSMKQLSGGKERWLAVRMDGPQGQVNVEFIEVGDTATPLALQPPSAKAEVLTDADDFPFFPPWPGSTRKNSTHADGPLLVSPPGTAEADAMLVGTGVLTRSYQGPATLSSLQFLRDSRDALVKAGWKILYPTDDKGLTRDASLVAHYEKNGRDVWLKLFFELGANLTFTVADVGAEDWATKFEKDCRLPLYGVFFDFNKATLKPESESVLKKAVALLSKKGFGVEVQGHTDSVGGDDSNVKLSGARAATVKTWLSGHGVEAARLTSKGYGKTQPIADNGTDEGRAKNRRVELVKAGCTK